MNLDTAREVADKFFQKSGEIKELSGERNPNFLVTTPVGKFVLKIHSADEVSQIKVSNPNNRSSNFRGIASRYW